MQAFQQSIPRYLILLIEQLRARLKDPAFLERHKCHRTDFTRERVLTFETVCLVILQKSTKSIERHLSEFFHRISLLLRVPELAATAGAWTQARAKLKPSAFEELNQEVVLPTAYSKERRAHMRFWHGMRLLGMDGSGVNIPVSPGIEEHFRVMKIGSEKKPSCLRRALGRMSVLYDLLNRLGLHALLVSDHVDENTLAKEHCKHTGPGDLVLLDSGYGGYLCVARIRATGAHFLVRCSRSGWYQVRRLFQKNVAGKSVIVTIRPDKKPKAQCRREGLPLEMEVRLITVRLPTGELEVLATSLLDEEAYPTSEFSDLYIIRWNHETFHMMLKSRLELENWSGLSNQAIAQDFMATLLVCNLESLLSEPAARIFEERSQHTENPLQPNRANGYHAVKDRIFELLVSQLPAEEVVEEIQHLFLRGPVSQRKGRDKPRRKLSANASLSFQRYRKKVVF